MYREYVHRKRDEIKKKKKKRRKKKLSVVDILKYLSFFPIFESIAYHLI